jgi:hypothetical protein
MSDLDPTTIMAEHQRNAPSHGAASRWCAKCGARAGRWPCLPYRLAAALAEAQERVAHLERLLDLRDPLNDTMKPT